jgi:intracellular sulfur oxidation DsrE/DsrF family protein
MKRWCISMLMCWLAAQAWAEVRVVYHLSDGVAQASRAMTNIRNHLEADPDVKIVVVAHGAGLDFLLDGALGANGQPFAGTIADLTNKGVRFAACNNTMQNRKITRDRLVLEAVVVPSGVAEVARLQAREQFVYLRP